MSIIEKKNPLQTEIGTSSDLRMPGLLMKPWKADSSITNYVAVPS
jgi:hypothetical protein